MRVKFWNMVHLIWSLLNLWLEVKQRQTKAARKNTMLALDDGLYWVYIWQHRYELYGILQHWDSLGLPSELNSSDCSEAKLFLAHRIRRSGRHLKVAVWLVVVSISDSYLLFIFPKFPYLLENTSVTVWLAECTRILGHHCIALEVLLKIFFY